MHSCGQRARSATGAVAVPIYQTSTYVQEALGKHKGYEYARTQNPTRAALEENMAVLEGGAGARAFASGMAAITAVATFVKQGDHVVCSNMTYGGTYRYYTKILARYGVEFAFVDTSDPEEVERAFRDKTRLLHLESPTNPTMTICDIALLSELAHERGAIVVVDNTFASPYLQKPLALGADLVMHSTTKFLDGHSDTVGGVAIAKRTPSTSSGSHSCRTARARSSRRSIRFSSCAASRRSSSGWSATRKTAARSPSTSPRTRR